MRQQDQQLGAGSGAVPQDRMTGDRARRRPWPADPGLRQGVVGTDVSEAERGAPPGG